MVKSGLSNGINDLGGWKWEGGMLGRTHDRETRPPSGVPGTSEDTSEGASISRIAAGNGVCVRVSGSRAVCVPVEASCASCPCFRSMWCALLMLLTLKARGLPSK